MTCLLLSCMFGAASALLGLWYATKDDARLMDVRAQGLISDEPDGTFQRLRSHFAVAAFFGLAAWILAARLLSGQWPTLFGIPPALICAGAAWERRKRSRWLAAVKGEWPVLLESMAVGALAGLDLNSAFVAASKRVEGPLREETERVVVRLSGGARLSRALGALVERAVPGSSRLLGALLQAEVLGTPAAEMLRGLSLEASILQRQELESQFNALPLKMSVVTVVFLLPPLLVVSIAPHVLMFLESRW